MIGRRFEFLCFSLSFILSSSYMLTFFIVCTTRSVLVYQQLTLSLPSLSSYSLFMSLCFTFFPPVFFQRRARQSIVFTILLSSAIRHSCLYFDCLKQHTLLLMIYSARQSRSIETHDRCYGCFEIILDNNIN